MIIPTKDLKIRLSVVSFLISAILFVIYPVLRPFSDETTLEGAAAFASTEWVIAHILAMIAFILLPLGLSGIYQTSQKNAVKAFFYWAFVFSLIGVGLILPFYGGETFGLYAVGQEVVSQQSVELIGQADMIRGGAGVVMFIIGFLSLTFSSILLAIGLWKSEYYPKFSGVPFALGIFLYLPQFFFEQPIRVIHGLVLAVGCILIAYVLWNKRTKQIHGNHDETLSI